MVRNKISNNEFKLKPRCSNILMKRLRPSLWIPSIMFVWGIVSKLYLKTFLFARVIAPKSVLSMAFVKSYHTLIVYALFVAPVIPTYYFPSARVFLGLAEAGLPPGVGMSLFVLNKDNSQYHLSLLGYNVVS